MKITDDDPESSAMKKRFISYEWHATPGVMMYLWEDVIDYIDVPKHASKSLFYAVPPLEKLIWFWF